MRAGAHRLAWWLLLPAALATPTARAGTFAKVESSYLGDGWFRYAVTMYDDPFLRNQLIYRLGTWLFTNRVEFGSVPPHWADGSAHGHEVYWNYTGASNSQVPIYYGEFHVHSAQRGFRMTNSFLVLYQLWPELWLNSTNWYDGMLGYALLPCLVPCPPGQSDGSPSNLTASFEVVSDAVVHRVTPFTVSYSWGSQYTALISGTSNFLRWTNIAYVLGYSGTNTWTSAVPLSAYGHVFRIGILSDRHLTNW